MIENYSLSVPEWLKLSADTRTKLAEIFQISKSKGAQIETMGEQSVVKSDGHTHEDLQAITVEKMQGYLGENFNGVQDFLMLFNTVVRKVEEVKAAEAPKPIDTKALMLEEWVAILSRLKGQSVEHQMEQELLIAIKQLFNIKEQTNVTQNAGLPAKAGRPKKAN